MTDIIQQINNCLPQTQCGQCGFKACHPYAQAIAEGRADINQCPPGGDEGILALAKLLNVPVKPLNALHGIHKPQQVAFIIERDCIGCVKCIAACPVDAILGAAKLMHTVIATECTGCELCIAPCPVDCIVMQPVEKNNEMTKRERADRAKSRFEARNIRKKREIEQKAERIQQKKAELANLK